MSASQSQTTVLASLPVGQDDLALARGMRAGDWVFANGIAPTRFAPPSRPLSGEPDFAIQARSVWESLGEVLAAGDADVSRMVRSDQFLPDWRAMPFFHESRRQACGKYIAPSTSVLLPGLLWPRACVTSDVIARSRSGGAVEAIYPDGLDVPSTSSFAPAARAGGLVFVAGFMAAWKPGDLGGIAPEAKVPEGHLWKGNRAQLEVEYLVRRKLEVALKGAGIGLDRVAKANILLRDIEDVPAINQVWRRLFGDAVPATTFLQTRTPGFAIEDARMEINLVAADAGTPLERVPGAAADGAVCDGLPAAVRAGDLLMLSGLVAADANGLVAGARRDPDAPYFVTPIEAEMTRLIEVADRICAAAGARLENVVRIQQAHTNLNDFHAACRAWQKRLPGRPLPVSAVQTPSALVPGGSVQVDLWVYAPRG